MLFLAIILLLTSLIIAGVAAYFSIIGLSLLFVGSGTAIIVMGSALEIGKLVAVTSLHHLWDKLNGILKTYLFAATIILSIITSIGIYGYLSNGYNTTSIKVHAYQQNIEQNEKKVKLLSEENLKLANIRLPDSVTSNDQNKQRDTFAEQQLKLIEQKETKISDIRKSVDVERNKATDERQSAKNVLDNEINKEVSQITLYNNRLQILDKEVQTWLDQGTGGMFKQNGLLKARSVKESQQKERDVIDTQIKTVQLTIEKLRLDYNKTLATVDAKLTDQIKILESNIQKLEKEILDIQTEISNNKKIIEETASKNLAIKLEEAAKFEDQVKYNKAVINQNDAAINSLSNQNKDIALKINETDVGTFKFVAKNFNLDIDTTVNWFIILIIFVFDPLAVTLLLCFNYILNEISKKKTGMVVEQPSPSVITTTPPIETSVLPKTDTLEFGIDDGEPNFPYIHTENIKADGGSTGIAYKSYPKPPSVSPLNQAST